MDSTHCAQIITLQPLRMLRYVIFVLNAIGLALWALTFFEFICANVAKLARKRYLVHDICQSTLILACKDAHPNAPYSLNEVDFEKKKEKNLLWPFIAEILHYHYGKSSNYFLNIKRSRLLFASMRKVEGIFSHILQAVQAVLSQGMDLLVVLENWKIDQETWCT